MKNKERNLNFDLMRMISMFLIIAWHIIIHGAVLSNCKNYALRLILDMSTYFIVVHVNSFVLLTGHFQSTSACKCSKVIKLFLQVLFYSVAILILAINLDWVKGFHIVDLFNNITLNALNNYWFIKTYLILYLFSDFINKFIDRLSKEEYKNFLILGFFLLSVIPFITGYRVLENTGFSLINFIYLYTIGGYFRRYPLKESYHFKNMTLNGYRCLLIFLFFILGLSNFFVNHLAIEAKTMGGLLTEISNIILASRLHYATPFVIIQSFVYFEFFKTLNCKRKIWGKISCLIFGIYLIHDNPLIREHIYKILKIDNGVFTEYQMLLKIVGCALLIFFVCLIIEAIRYGICKLIGKIKWVQKISTKIKNFLNSFHFKIKMN